MKALTINIYDNENLDDITQYLSSYDRHVETYNGNYTAEWLLSDIYADVWIMKTKKTVIKSDGTYRYSTNLRWDRLLPNGSRLSDAKNKPTKELIQRLCFLSYQSPAVGNITALSSLVNLYSGVMLFVAWSFLHEDKFNPNKYGFNRITQKDLQELIEDYSSGGAFKMLDVGERFFSNLEKIYGKKIERINVFSLPNKERKRVIQFFKENGFYKKNNRGIYIVDRSKIESDVGLGRGERKGDFFSLLMRQFEPELIKENKEVLLPINMSADKPSHKTPLIKDMGKYQASYRSTKELISILETFMKVPIKEKNKLPSVESIRFGELRNLATELGKNTDKTPLIPLENVMFMLNKSIGIVVNQGEHLMSFYFKCIDEFTRRSYIGEEYSSVREKFVLNNIPEQLSCLGIDGFFLGEKPLSKMMSVLQGACIFIMASLKPLRMSELISLPYNCLYYKEGDGYWLMQSFSKSGINNELPEGAKPIPSISAKAIELLMEFNDGSVKYGDNVNKKLSKYLFFGLALNRFDGYTLVKNSDQIIANIEVFTDYINLPTDQYGRRWYSNIHELRKSFLLTFFWIFKFSSLDSCRWLAGHKDSEHIFNYITENTPGEEMVEIESEFATEQLKLFNEDNSLSDIENLEELRADVCNHFGVAQLAEVNEDELTDWIQSAIQRGKYKIHAYDIESTDELLNVRFAFVINEVVS